MFLPGTAPIGLPLLIIVRFFDGCYKSDEVYNVYEVDVKQIEPNK